MTTQGQTASAVATIFSDVLANLAFMFTDDDQAEVAETEVWLETRISYHGPMQGTLRFRCPERFAELLAANLLGLDPDNGDAKSSAVDAVKEFMNIICGQLVTTLYSTHDVYDLTIPEVTIENQPPSFAPEEGIESSRLSVEGHLVQLSHIGAGKTGSAK